MRCRNSGHVQLEMPPQGLEIPPKILYIDIETALMSADIYDLHVRSGYLSRDFITRHSYVINWAAAWLNQEYKIIGKIMSGVCTNNEAKTQNDRRIVGDIWDLMEEADYIGGHNSNNFDIKN